MGGIWTNALPADQNSQFGEFPNIGHISVVQPLRFNRSWLSAHLMQRQTSRALCGLSVVKCKFRLPLRDLNASKQKTNLNFSSAVRD